MRKLDLESFNVTRKVKGGDGEIIEITGPYNVRDSVITILFLPALELRGAVLVRQNVLAMKIEQCDGHVILEEEEYERVKHAAELYPGECRADATLIDRILNHTPEIDVEEVPGIRVLGKPRDQADPGQSLHPNQQGGE